LKTGTIIVGVIGLAAALVLWLVLDWFILSKAAPEVHLLPDGFKGPVFIAFNRLDGEQERYEDGKRVYVIPNNGILKTKFPPNDGTQHDWQYYYQNVDGKRVAIPYVIGTDVLTKDLDRVIVFAIHTVSAPSDRTKKDMSFFTYVVGTPREKERLIRKQQDVNLNAL